MNCHIYYYRPHKCWYGYWMDETGNQLGDAVKNYYRDNVLLDLGQKHDECRSILLGNIRKMSFSSRGKLL